MTRDEPTRCPQCGAVRIAGRSWPGSTAGPVEHVKTGCERDHGFPATVDSLDLRPAPTAAEPPPVPIPVD